MVDLGALTEVVLRAAKRALDDRSAEAPGPEFRFPPIILGLIIDPRFSSEAPSAAVITENTEK